MVPQYNQLCGRDEFYKLTLMALGLERQGIPAFRDAYPNHLPELIIFTRTGGQREPFFRNQVSRKSMMRKPDDYSGPWLEALTSHPLYVRTMSHKFDETYVTFHYMIPEEWGQCFKVIRSFRGRIDHPVDRMLKKFALIRRELEDPNITEERRAVLMLMMKMLEAE